MSDALYASHRYWSRLLCFADAEQAKNQGGMVALYPRTVDAQAMTVSGGESAQELHLTLAYMGEDVTNVPDAGLQQAIAELSDSYSVISARVFGHAVFNPDGGDDGDKDPCAVYLIGDSADLASLRQQVQNVCSRLFNLPDQHEPFIPHITAQYRGDANHLAFTGQVQFDRLGVAWMGQTTYLPLAGA